MEQYDNKNKSYLIQTIYEKQKREKGVKFSSLSNNILVDFPNISSEETIKTVIRRSI